MSADWQETRIFYSVWLHGWARHRVPWPQPGHRVAAVVGSAPEAFDDVTKLQAMGVGVDWVAVNSAARLVVLPWRHFMAIDFYRGRQQIMECLDYLGEDVLLHSVDEPGRIEAGAHFLWRFGNRILRMSGPWAACVCLGLGYSRVVMCGCGMNHNGHVPDGGDDAVTSAYPARWQSVLGRAIVKNLGPQIRSMSGLTKQSLGAPTKGWLAA